MTTKPVAASSGKKRKLVNVHLLNGEEHVVHVDVKAKFQEVFNQVAGQLSLRETEYFGLAFKKDNEYHFIVLDEKIHKLAPKQWKSGPGEGVDSQGKPLINVWFRVQFYVDQVILLREKVTRHQYYLQLKENVLQYNHLYNEEKCFQLAAYALQADHGNYVAGKHESGYFNPVLYFPHWMLERHGTDYLANNMPTIHKDLHNMTRNDAELRYIRNASMPPGAHNLHFYTVRKRKSDKACNTWLAICAKGVEVYEDDAGYKNHISTFMWRDIGKLYFDKKKFEIRSVQSAGGRRFMYYTDCDIKSKYLLSICRSTHMFQMAIQPKLMEIQHLDNEDQKRYRESYIYSDSRDRSHFHHSPSKSVSAAGSTSNQRFSLISDVSSNTTSGIVSDRMAVSFDDGDDHTREIMIDCPPRSAMSGTPSQSRSKFQLLSSFKQSSQSSKTSPSQIPHSLELCKTDGMAVSPQKLSPTSSNGSWRARHSQTPACLVGASSLPLPSPTTPTQDGKSYPAIRRSVGRKDSFSKQLLQTTLHMSGDRNTSGDSAVSVSGIFTGSDKLAPLSLPPSEHRTLPSSSGASGGSGRGSGGSSNYSLTPPLTLSQLKKTSGPSPPTSLSFSSSPVVKDSSPHGFATVGANRELGEHYKPLSSPREPNQQYKPLSSPRELSEKLNSLSSPRANIPEHYGKSLSSPRSGSEQHYKPMSSPMDVNKTYKTLGTARDLKHPVSPRGLPEYKQALNTPRIENNFAFHASAKSQPAQAIQGLPLDTSKTQIHPSLDAPLSKDNYQVVTALVHQNADQPPQQPQKVHQSPRAATEHYLLALQQGSAQLMEQQTSSPRGGIRRTEDLPALSGMVHLHQMPYQPVQQPEQQQQHQHHHQLLQQQQQNQQQLQHEYYPYNITGKEIQMGPTNVQTQLGNSDAVQEMEENKENLYHVQSKEEREEEEEDEAEERKDQVDISDQQSHTKGNLHPELKQILGQSHAISLPLITALCNDSSLMQASRSQSGSRSSYDTSTVRSTDSRLTRFSHDTDPRRWSSCCQAAGMPDAMVSMQSPRPYSWHSEHFELDSQLALPSTDYLPPTSPPNPRAVNNKHLAILDHHSNLPQKMIESDPGPSSPRMITNYNGTSWWDAPNNGADPSSSSWADAIPYSYPTPHLSSKNGNGSQQLVQHHQHMVPHKLSSGGHRDSDTSIAHKQILKENVGIA